MTPAEELLAAATKLRETVRLAHGDHWRGEADELGRGWDIRSGLADLIAFGLTRTDVAWVSLASPAIAEPLATWLEALAAGWEKACALYPAGADARHSGHPALALARAINGGAP